MIRGEHIPGNVSHSVHETPSDLTLGYQTVLGIPHRAMYLSESNFKRAKEFIPERWLAQEQDTEFANDRRECFNPFSYGPRNCIGMK